MENLEVKYLSAQKVANRYDVNRATIWRWRKRVSDFPEPESICGNPRWNIRDLEVWDNKRKNDNQPFSGCGTERGNN